jgi:hypothetical protein
MWPEAVLPALLALQGIVGAADTLLNHEIIEKLPYRVEARGEIGLHALRETVYACLFLGVAWFHWHGAAGAILAVLVASEIGITAFDEVVENRIRRLPQNERLLHVFLTLNLGLITAVLVPTLLEWGAHPTGLLFKNYGALSIVLTVLGVAAGAWAIRDALAWRRLKPARARNIPVA